MLFYAFKKLECMRFAFLIDNQDPWDFGESLNQILDKHSLEKFKDSQIEKIEETLEENDFITMESYFELTKERGLSLFLISPKDGFWSDFAIVGIQSRSEMKWENKIIGDFKLDPLVE